MLLFSNPPDACEASTSQSTVTTDGTEQDYAEETADAPSYTCRYSIIVSAHLASHNHLTSQL